LSVAILAAVRPIKGRSVVRALLRTAKLLTRKALAPRASE